jgi:pyrroline-5-carboxylate reductase
MIGFIGGGNMAEALIKGIAENNGGIIVSEPREERRKFLADTYGVEAVASNCEVAEKSDIIILAIKPQSMAVVLDEITASVSSAKTVVSIAAGITLSFLKSRLKTELIIRVMPNSPSLVQEGMSVLSYAPGFPEETAADVVDIFSAVGKVLVLPEKQINAVTALSGSGPAFIAFFAEAMISSGEKMGLDRNDAALLAIQTLIGTASLLRTGIPPEALRRAVTSPGGTTAAGIETFEEQDLWGLVENALAAAAKRAEELSASK